MSCRVGLVYLERVIRVNVHDTTTENRQIITDQAAMAM